MRIAYLIVGHNTPRHARRLISALASPSAEFFVHWDNRSSLDALEVPGSKVHFVTNRISVHWGEFSQVEATLKLINAAMGQSSGFEYLVLLSGSDYPLRSASYIERFFEKNSGMEFISIVQMPCERGGKPLSRLSHYSPRSEPSLANYIDRVKGGLEKLGLLSLDRDYKTHLGDLVPYAGSSWWALSAGACKYILRFVERQHPIVKFLENTVCPDEMFFQTVLGNSPFRARMRRSLTWTDWSAGDGRPATLGMKQIVFFESCPEIKAGPSDLYGEGELLFARKFPDDSEDLVRRIDRMIDKMEGRIACRFE